MYLHYDEDAMRIRAAHLHYCDVAEAIGAFIWYFGGNKAT
jgi:hypothetical protein